MAKILENGYFYMQLPKMLINSAIFFLLGEMKDLSSLDAKALDENDKKWMNVLFKKVYPPPMIKTAFR
jgi:hypothetical protein